MENNNRIKKLNLSNFSNFIDVFKDVGKGTITRILMNQIIEYIQIKGDAIDIG